MDGLSKGELRTLVEPRTGPCVTLYMPTHDAGADIQQDPIRFKNLLREAEERLRAKGMKQPEVDAFLGEARKLLDLDRIFWRSPKASFAMFVAPGFFKYYHLPLKLQEHLHVEGRFHTKPLMRLLSSNGRFFILALSQDQIRLLEATQYTVRQCELKSTPTNITEALQYNELEQAPQFRVANSGPGDFQAKQEGVFFGHGGGIDPSDVKKDDLREYFRAVDKGLHGILADDNAPIILAGVNYLLPMYREVNTYPHMLTEGIVGSPELLGNEELHAQAWPIAREYLLTGEREAVAKFQNLTGSAKTSIDLKEILSAAHQGRIETIFVANGRETWGRYDVDGDATTIETQQSVENTDLLDLAATQTFSTGGRVYVVDPDAVPGGESVAAVFRF
jgi:hypothetical protein